MFYLTSFVIVVLCLLILPYTCNGQVWCSTFECARGSNNWRCAWVSSRNGYYCECKDGYRLNEDLVCEDIDECEWNVCGSRTCENYDGSYNCKRDWCSEGFLSESYLDPCNDINECEFPVCGPSGTCKNYSGFYGCKCYSGYDIGPDGRCYDIHECIKTPNICGLSSAGRCVNTAGSYTCECFPGYTLINNICTDDDECSNPSLCGPPASGSCVNLPGTYNCTCFSGYQSDISGKCTDIDECSNPYICGSQSAGQCNNTDGSYTCQCYDGYQLWNNTCQDVDECKNNSTCDDNAECTNFLGGYNCTCTTGFSGDGRSCTDVNECENATTCDHNAECKNLPGSYACACIAGFTGDGVNCTAVSSASATFSNNPGVIAGAVVGILLGVVVVTSLLVIVIRRRNQKKLSKVPPLSKPQPIEHQPSYVNVRMSDVRAQENQNRKKGPGPAGPNNVEDMYANRLVKERKKQKPKWKDQASSDNVNGQETNGSVEDMYSNKLVKERKKQKPKRKGQASSDNVHGQETNGSVEDMYSNKLVKEKKQRQKELEENTFSNDIDPIYANESNGNGAGDPYDALCGHAYKQNPRRAGPPDDDTYNQLHQRPLEMTSIADGAAGVELYNHLYGGGKVPHPRKNPLQGRKLHGNDDAAEYSLAN